jgi:mannose-1-phosphate guanylyltransferase/mannose-6-phosphate isomerase
LIKQPKRFGEALGQALVGASKGLLVTFGVVPDAPETGYGYLRQGEAIESAGLTALSAFVEKPDADTAQSYLESGDYFWNSGMFVFQAQVFLAELARYQATMSEACAIAADGIVEKGDFHWLPRAEFAACPSDSIDYAVMEKTDHAAMVQLDAGWNDLGSWDAVWKVMNKNSANNVTAGDVVTVETFGSYVQAESRLVTTVGLSNVIVIDTADALLVADMNHAQLVKDVVKKLEGRVEAELHRKVFRPWGSFESVAVGHGYQVKHIVVNPGQALSLQLHHQRSEHWTVIQGEAVVEVGEETRHMRRNESVYIPVETRHRLTNESSSLLEVIEVQIGDYLGEDDIVRFEDNYGRVEQP